MQERPMLTIERTLPEEPALETMKFIESKRNWSIRKQAYKIPPQDEHRIEYYTKLTECRIYYRGKYLILQRGDMIHYWDSEPYCFLELAVSYMRLDKAANWKTLHRLITLRMGIRETEVACLGYVEDILSEEVMTYKLYKHFIRLARAHDLLHHGSSTF